MTTSHKTISALVDRQLPDFVRADHPQFKRFIELYYAWLEDESKGNTVYHIMNSDKYRDIDETLDPFIRLFKQELLPYFPETTRLQLPKILKGAREFYVKKGSEESVKWLFRVLFGEDIEVFYPKEQILIASDGKWKLPQAFQLTLSAANQDIDPNLLEKHKGIGSISKATCIIESANKTIDKNFGNEILEIYVSGVNKEFQNGENLEIEYVDEFGVINTFVEKIIGAISAIRIDSNIRIDPNQTRRGLLYNVGDPVVVFGGLAESLDAEDAIAYVGNVTMGSVEGLAIQFPGYGYRVYTNTEVVVLRSVGDDPNANQSTDVRVAGINVFEDANNSQAQYLEYITVDKMPIEYLANTLLSDPDYAVFTGNNRNIVLTIDNDSDVYYNNERVYANGSSFETANFTAQILTANTGWIGGPGNVILYNVANTVPLETTGFLIGTDTLISTQSGSVFNVSVIVANTLDANIDSTLLQALTFEELETGGVALYNIINGGFGFRSSPTIGTISYYDTFWSENFDYGTAEQAAYRQPLGAFGYIAHIWITNGGSGYANGDTLVIGGGGYGFQGTVTVGVGGTITSINITNRGEGYFPGSGRIVSVVSGGGSGAVLKAYGFGEGVEVSVETGAIGRVRDVRLISRGFDYIEAPLVSFKVVDMVINPIDLSKNLSQGERVYQGATLETAIFQGIIKSFNRSTGALRLFNYSGASFSSFNDSLPFTSEGGVVFTIDTSATVDAPAQYPIGIIASGLPNPYFYGNGKARGFAEFFNGLIKYTGFYLNTDGFLSSDKKTQDGRTYHNYSYVIESERSLRDYRNSMTDIVHPIGMIMLARTVSNSTLKGSIRPATIVTTTSVNPVDAVVTVANSELAVVTGNNTLFAENAVVGDMFHIIDTTSPLRSQAKLIAAVTSNTSLNVESNFVYVGQGKLRITDASATAYVSGNTNAVSDFIRTGDVLRMNVNSAPVTVNVAGISGNVLTLNTVMSNTVTGLVYLVVPDYTDEYDYKIVKGTD